MNELLQVFTAFGMMVAGPGDRQPVTPQACEQEFNHKPESVLNLVLQRHEVAPQKYVSQNETCLKTLVQCTDLDQ